VRKFKTSMPALRIESFLWLATAKRDWRMESTIGSGSQPLGSNAKRTRPPGKDDLCDDYPLLAFDIRETWAEYPVGRKVGRRNGELVAGPAFVRPCCAAVERRER
jgi:hypothetical protein